MPSESGAEELGKDTKNIHLCPESSILFGDDALAALLDPACQNEVLIARLFRLEPETESTAASIPDGETFDLLAAQQAEERGTKVYLREFIHSILDAERSTLCRKMVGTVDRVAPLSFWRPGTTYYELARRVECEAIERREQQLPPASPQLSELPRTDVIFVEYELGKSIGCQHYVRGCQVKCEECGKFYGCRVCHDEAECDHLFPRDKTTTMRCLFCHREQPLGTSCAHCGRTLATYFCQKCRLVCGQGPDAKPNYHCDKCGICRVGLEEESVHCDTCNRCYLKVAFPRHRCVSSIGNCLACLESLDCSRHPYIMLGCGNGHYMHVHCYEMMASSPNFNYKCPVCRKLVLSGEQKEDYNAHCEEILRTMVLPDHYREILVRVACDECGCHFSARKHPLVYRCPNPECLSYNCSEVHDSDDASAAELQEQEKALLERGVELVEPPYERGRRR